MKKIVISFFFVFSLITISAGNSVSSTKSSLLVDWDNIQNEFVQMVNSGIEKMIPGLLALLSVLTVLEIMWVLYSYVVKNILENLWISLLRIMIKFSILRKY